MRFSRWFCAVLWLSCFPVTSARAQPTAANSATPGRSFPDEARREAAAAEAQRLYNAGKLAEAAEKFREAIAIRPTALTLWGLALAEEALGQTEAAEKHFAGALTYARGGDEGAEGLRASLVVRGQKLIDEDRLTQAAARLRDAVSIRKTADALRLLAVTEYRAHQYLAAKRHLDEALVLAKKQGPASEIAPIGELLRKVSALLGRLTILVPKEATGARVTVDGENIPAPWSAVDAEPGRRRVVVEAPGRERFSTTIEAVAGREVEVEVELSVIAAPFGGQKVGALVAWGGAVVALGVGIGTGVHAINLHDELAPLCPAGQCASAQHAKVDAYYLTTGAANVAFAIAGGAAVLGGILWLTAPNGAVSVAPTIGIGQVGLVGRF